MIRKSMILKTSIAVFSASLITTAAWAWGRNESLTLTVQTSDYTVKQPNGKVVTAHLAYSVTSTFYVREDGNAHWPDNRSCHFVGQPSQFVRDLNVVIDGKPIELGVMSKSEPAPANQDFSDNCNTVVGDQHHLNDAQKADIGDAHKWQADINADQIEVQRLLALLGKVTSPRVVDIKVGN